MHPLRMMLVIPGKVSLFCFLTSCTSLLVFTFKYAGYEDLGRLLLENLLFYLPGHYIAINLIIGITFKGFLYQVAVRACLLGAVFSGGFFLTLLGPSSLTLFGWYMSVLSFFHFSEFLAIAICNPNTLSIESFIIDHSLDYKIAAVASWVEFFVEKWLFPELKEFRIVPAIGLTVCICGELLRKIAMVTASSNFTHTVASKKAKNHKLVTTGVYSYCRHPSYVGWFYWSIGTQVVLANPLCIIAYALASWKFFNDRITIEEVTLLSFFDYDYADYQERVPTGLPFIKGFRLSN